MEEIKTLGNLTKKEEETLRRLLESEDFKFYQLVMSGYLRIKEKNVFTKAINDEVGKMAFARNQGEYIAVNGWIVGLGDRLDEVAEQKKQEKPKVMKKSK